MSNTTPNVAAEGKRVNVIGAGIVGITCANILRDEGYQVTVVDEREPGRGCSFGNGGAVSPDSCVPFSLPGMLTSVPRWLFDPSGPVTVKWGYFPRAFPWLLRWVRAGREDRARQSAAGMRALHRTCLEGYRALLGEAGYADLIRTSGQIYVYNSARPGPTEVLAQSIRREHGVRTIDLGPDEIRELEPAIGPSYARGRLFPDNHFTISPYRLVRTLADRFLQAGGHITRACVHGFEIGPDGVRALRTEADEIAGDAVVIAAGAWSDRLASKLGSRVPLEAERGYHVMLPNSGIALRHKIMNFIHMFGATSMEEGLQITGTVEIAGVDAPPDERRAKVLLELGRRMLPGLNDEGPTTWMGCRPSIPDSLPVIDRSPRFANVYFAFGHGHVGLAGAPMTARIIADLMADRAPPIDPRPYRVDRF